MMDSCSPISRSGSAYRPRPTRTSSPAATLRPSWAREKPRASSSFARRTPFASSLASVGSVLRRAAIYSQVGTLWIGSMLGARAKAQVAYDLDVEADRLGDKLLQDVEILRRVSAVDGKVLIMYAELTTRLTEGRSLDFHEAFRLCDALVRGDFSNQQAAH